MDEEPFASPNAHDQPPHAAAFRPSWTSWVPSSAEQLATSEQDILHPILGSFQQSKIGNLNTIYSIHPSSSGPPLLLLHGFAGGVGLWVCLWKALCETHTVYAIDLPGFARSDRVPYMGTTPEESISYFLLQIEDWVVLSRIPTPFVLMGHSLGGYISSHFTFQNPTCVSKLILLDPWGVQKDLPKWLEEELQSSWYWRTAAYLTRRINALSIMRALGPWAAEQFGKRRSDIGKKYQNFFADTRIVTDYLFHCNAGYPAGEAAFFAMYDIPWAAKRPLEEEFISRIPSTTSLVFFYGEDTWMEASAGEKIALTFAGRAEFLEISHAGHNVFSDNYREFLEKLVPRLAYERPSCVSNPKGKKQKKTERWKHP